MKKRILSMILCLCLVMSLLPGTARADASGTCGANASWTLVNGLLTISGTGAMDNYNAWYDTSTIKTEFKADTPWFDMRASIKKVIIEEGITTIGAYAFLKCEALTQAAIPDTVTEINRESFGLCTSLKSIEIPDRVTVINADTFNSCSSLTHIKIPDTVTRINTQAFIGCKSLTNLALPASLTYLGKAVLAASGLTRIEIPAGVTTIPELAFDGCADLTSVTIANGVAAIGDEAFRQCGSLTNIEIPASISSINAYAFYGAAALSEIRVDINNQHYASKDGVLFTKDMSTVIVCPNGKSGNFAIPDTVKRFENRAFAFCDKLTGLIIPGSVTDTGAVYNNSLDISAFYGCSGLTSAGPVGSGCDIQFGWTESIPAGTFYGCDNLTSVTIPASVTSIGDSAFAACTNLTIYCYKNSCAHQYAEQWKIPFVLLDGEPEPEPSVSIQSVILTRNGEVSDLLTQTTEFEYSSVESASVSAEIDWGNGEAGRVFLIQSRDKYAALPAAIAPGTLFVPDAPIYVIATNADASVILGWKPTALRVVEPAPPLDDNFAVTLSLWDDAGCTNRITSMINTYGSFSWGKTGSNFDTVYLKIDYTGVETEEVSPLILTAPEGFSFAPDRIETTWAASVTQASGAQICPVYPIYSENYQEGGVLEFTAEISSLHPGGDFARAALTVPVLKNQSAGEVYYRDSFTEKQTGPVLMNNFSMEGFTQASTLYNQNIARLSAYFSAAAYNRDGVERTLQNFGFSKIAPFNYNPINDQVSLDQDQVACAFATKKYIVDGEVYTVVAVVIRGTVSDEWYSNFDIGSGFVHQGFFNAKSYVCSLFQSYMAELQAAGLTAEHTKLLITGHSRGAAAADLLAVDLNTLYQDQYAMHDGIYTYTFATPNSVANSKTYLREAQNNIFNIINYQDIIVHVPGAFYSPGINLYVNYPGDEFYQPKLDAFETYFKDSVTDQSDASPKPEYYSWGKYAADFLAECLSKDNTYIAETYGPAIADLMLGKLTSVSTAALAALILEVAADEIILAGASGVGAVVTEAAAISMAISYAVRRIWPNHAIEAYICWLNVISDGHSFSIPSNGAYIKVMCPVDVTVYDKNHITVSKIVNNEVVISEGPYCGVIGEEKIFCLAGSDYTLEITGYDSGSMDIEITEYDENNQKTKLICYKDIPVVQGETSTMEATDCGTDNSAYMLTVNMEEKEPDYVSVNSEIDALSVSVETQGSGTVLGSGRYSAGERVTLYALADNSAFDGWYVNGILVCGERIYSFNVTDNVIITARFTSSTSIPVHSVTGTGGSGSYALPTYKPEVEQPEHGSVTVIPSSPKEGDKVAVTPAPDDGYTVDEVIVTGQNGKPVSVTEREDGTYTFIQPAGKVKITVTYKAIEPVIAEWINPFTDVSASAWYYDAVRFVSESGLMNGYGDGRFGPGDNLSRAQFAQILYSKEGRPAVTDGGSFTDVTPGQWYTPAITWAAANGIVDGYGSGLFGPNDPITREQLAAMFWRYSGSPAAANTELPFNDGGETGAFALEAMRWAVENGIIGGTGGGILDPKGLAARAQAAQLLKNCLDR